MSLAVFQNDVPVSKNGIDHMKFLSDTQATPNTFDEFFENELYHLNKATASSESLSIIEQYLDDIPTQDNDQILRTRSEQEVPVQAWRKGLWCMNQQSAPDVEVAATRSAQSQSVFVSPGRLDNDSTSLDPSLHPEYYSLPNCSLTAAIPDAPLMKPPRMLRQQTLSPTPMYAHHLGKADTREQDAWYQTFPNLSIQPEAEMVRTGMVAKHRRSRDNNAQVNSHLLDTYYPSMSPRSSPGPRRYHYPFQYTNPSPERHGRLEMGPVAANAYNEYPELFPPIYDATRTALNSSRNALHLDTSRTPFDSQFQAGLSTASNCYSPPYSLMSAPLAKQEFRPENVAKASEGAPYTEHYHIPHPSLNGLGIRYPSPDEIGRAVHYEPIRDRDLPTRVPADTSASFATYSVPPFQLDSGNTARRGPKAAHYRSLSASPMITTSIAPRFSRQSVEQHSPSKLDSSHRKSINRNGPMREVVTSTAFQEQKRSPSRARSRSQSRSQPRTRSSSAKARKQTRSSNVATSGAVFDFDFVNFTPEDSAKLMADVAPSGSSKTRARREQEAREKRKKLNEVALSAVKAAGGNVRELQRRLVS